MRLLESVSSLQPYYLLNNESGQSEDVGIRSDIRDIFRPKTGLQIHAIDTILNMGKGNFMGKKGQPQTTGCPTAGKCTSGGAC